VRGLLVRSQDAVLALVVAGAALALVVPSHRVADRSDWLLAALVLLVALTIPPDELAAVRRRWASVVALSVVPLVALAAIAFGVSRLFDGAVRDGVLALGVAPTEVSSASLVAIAGGGTAMALAVVTGSLVVCALVGPVYVATVADANVGGGELLGEFALVVLLPLALGLAARGLHRELRRLDAELSGASAIVLAALVYAAMSGTDVGELGAPLAGAALFLVAGFALAAAWYRLRPADGIAGAFTVALRDFAVAAGLATQAFGSRAAPTAAIYGVLMLVAGALVATAARRRGRAAPP
jgi:predicted Na+-dependent transporter